MFLQKRRRQELPCATRIDYTGQPVEPPPSTFSLPFVIELDLESSILDPGVGENQRFCYRKTGVGEDNSKFRDLGHEVFHICEEITEDQIKNIQVFIDGEEQEVIFGNGGNVELRTPDKPDPPTGCPGLKFDFGLSKVAGAPGSTMFICFELTQKYPVGPIEVCEFGGDKTARGLTICGPVCEGVSIAKNCPIGDFREGDNIAIDIIVTNTGSETVDNIIVTDELDVPAGVTINNLQADFPAAIDPPSGPYTGPTTATITSQNLGPLDPKAILNLQIRFDVISVSAAGFISDSATVTSNSITDTDSCEVSVVVTPPPPVRGLKARDFMHLE